MPIQVAIVEDNAGVRNSWASLIDAESDLKCVGAVMSGEDALNNFPQAHPDVVLMDVNLPGMNGIECSARLKQLLPETQIIMVTVYDDDNHVFDALRFGATGYLLKTATADELLNAIRDITRGGAPMTGYIARRIIDSFRTSPGTKNTLYELLTHREQETLELLAKGLSNKEISSQLGIATETVRVHVRHIYEKLQVRSRTEAASKYFMRGHRREESQKPEI